MLQLIPSSAANAAGVDYEMKSDLTQAESIRFETAIMVCWFAFVSVVEEHILPLVLSFDCLYVRNDVGSISTTPTFQDTAVAPRFMPEHSRLPHTSMWQASLQQLSCLLRISIRHWCMAYQIAPSLLTFSVLSVKLTLNNQVSSHLFGTLHFAIFTCKTPR